MKRKKYVHSAMLKYIKENSLFYIDYSNWYVGVTAKPEQRKVEHGSPVLWRDWEVDDPSHARELEKALLALGCKGASGGGNRTKHVYIYKHAGPYSGNR